MSDVLARIEQGCTVNETFSEAELPGAVDRSVSYSTFDLKQTLRADTEPPVSAVYADEPTGNLSLDLTDIDRPTFDNVDATGLKLQVFMLNNLSETTDVVVATGAVNGYDINDGDDLTVKPGQRVLLFYNDSSEDVSGTKKAIDITAGVAETYELLMLFG